VQKKLFQMEMVSWKYVLHIANRCCNIAWASRHSCNTNSNNWTICWCDNSSVCHVCFKLDMIALSCVSEKGMNSHAILIWQQHCCVSSCLAFSAALLPSEEMENNLTPNLLKLWEKTTINFVRLFSVVKCGSSYTSSLHHPPPSQSAHWHWGHQGGSMFRHAQESRYTQAC